MGRKKRRNWSDNEKRMICAQTRVPGISVSQVARRYDVNANPVFTWLRDGRFSPDGDTQKQACFLPVEIIADVRHEDAPPVVAGGRIEFDLAGGHRLCVSGTYDPDALARLIRGLSGVIPVPSNTKVWLAAGVTDMRRWPAPRGGSGGTDAEAEPLLRPHVRFPWTAWRSDQDHLVGRSGGLSVLQAIGEGPVCLAFCKRRQSRIDTGPVGDASGGH